MRGKSLLALSIVTALLLAAGCILGPSKFRGVMSYRHGRVYIKHDRFYRVGLLPEGWERMKVRSRTISFYNPAFKSSISTDAYCGGGVSDKRLEVLGGEIVSALQDRYVVSETNFDLDGRGALRQVAHGTLDGVPVVVDLVVVRKNECVFDLYAVTPPDVDPEARQAFEEFFGGFHYE